MKIISVIACVLIAVAPEFLALDSKEGCTSACKFEGETATCKARVEWATRHVFDGQSDACGRAHSLVMRQCPHCSDGCSRAEVGCIGTQAVAPSRTLLSEADAALEEAEPENSTTEPAAGCASVCIYAERSVTCGARIKYAVKYAFADKGDSACGLAYNRVIEQCPSCSACSAASAGCHPRRRNGGTKQTTSTALAASAPESVTTPSPKSHYISDLRPPPSLPPSPPAFTTEPPSGTTSLGQDCMAVFLTCEKGFTSRTKEALCDERMGPCLRREVENYDCMQVYKNCLTGWSVRVIAWALQRDAGPFPTAMPLPTLAPTPAPVGPSGLGAYDSFVTTPVPPSLDNLRNSSSLGYDCYAGYSNWEVNWSRSKKEWCCQIRGLGCPEYATEASPPSKDDIVFKKFAQLNGGRPIVNAPAQEGTTAVAFVAAGSCVAVVTLLVMARISLHLAGQAAAASSSRDADRQSEQQLSLIDPARPLYLVE